MRIPPDGEGPSFLHTRDRRRVAQRVADGHRGLDDSSLLAFVSGSVVDGLADAHSDVDMSIVLATLPLRDELEQACLRAGGTPWFWSRGDLAEQQQAVVAFHVDGIEVQVAYATHAVLEDQLDELLVRHNPDTPLHKLAEGILKAEALFSQRPLEALQARLADFPPGLALAMARHFCSTPTPWRTLRQLLLRDAPLWSRDLQVQACYRLLGLLAAVNHRYYSSFQNKRLHTFAATLPHAPERLAQRMEHLLGAPPAEAALTLHGLEGEVLALVAQHFPAIDQTALQTQRLQFIAD